MLSREILKKSVADVRSASPLVHNITNFVVMNNTANALLAIGASPVMAHSIDEVSDMAGIASALVLNIGTLESAWVDSMLAAGKTAKARNIPIVFDPVGAGATPYRLRACAEILSEVKPSIIRGNASEIMALAKAGTRTKGVDSTASSDEALSHATALSRETGAVVVASGAVDVVTDGERVERIPYGHPLMGRVTGMGCTATAILGAFSAVEKDLFLAASCGMATMGIAGEIAGRTARGTGSMQVEFLDALTNLSDADIDGIFC